MTDDEDKKEVSIAVQLDDIIGEHETDLISELLASMMKKFVNIYDIPEEVAIVVSANMLSQFIQRYGNFEAEENEVEIVNAVIAIDDDKGTLQ